jgi:hypothetical protein
MQCGLGLKFITLIELGMMDMRFSHDMCEELHQIGKADKKKLIKPENTKVIDELANKRSMKKYRKEDSLAEAKAWEEMGENA